MPFGPSQRGVLSLWRAVSQFCSCVTRGLGTGTAEEPAPGRTREGRKRFLLNLSSPSCPRFSSTKIPAKG